jgi:shikimate kinase
MNIVLMGYRCTGKTAAGMSLAGLLGRQFVDTDEHIERQMGRTIPQIVAEGGWTAFRDAEAAAIRELSGADNCVIALGGGAVLDARNCERLKQGGIFVWLFASAETIAGRMEKDAARGAARPSLTGAPSVTEMNAVMAEREPLYRRLADVAVDTTLLSAGEVAETIVRRLGEQFPGAALTTVDPE